MHKKLVGLVVLFGLLVGGCTVLAAATEQRLADNAELVNAAMNSTVALVERGDDGLSAPQCTAFFVGPRILATANHCVEIPQYQVYSLGSDLTIRLPIPDAEPTIGSEVLFITHEVHMNFIRNYSRISEPVTHRAIVVQTNPSEDVALLRLVEGEPDSVHWFSMAPALPRIGERVYEIGMPSSQFWLFTEGMISSIREFPNGRTRIIHQAHVSPGASGGPLFNNFGQAVGVTTSFVRDAHYIGFATVISEVQRLVSQPVVMLGEPTILTDHPVSSSACQNITCSLPELE